MGEWWGPTPLRATAKIRQIFTLDDWWNLSLSLGANPGCVFFFFFFFFSLRLFPTPPPTLFVVVSHLEPANQLSCVLSTPIVIALSSASKKKKKSPSASWSLHKCSSLSVCRAWEMYLFFGFRGGGGDLRRHLDACRDITEQHVTGGHVITSPQVVFLSSLLSFKRWRI